MEVQEKAESQLVSDMNNCNLPKDEQVEDDEKKEEERTLTDHLNKKLLESFLQRMDQGEFDAFKTPSLESDNEEEWKNETDISKDNK